VVGCGGLGGYILEMLARIGIGRITAVDGGSFEISNLNRQILADSTTLGLSKTEAAKERLSKVNSDITVRTIPEMLNDTNAQDILKNHQIIVDALDNVAGRLLLEHWAERLEVPLVHGAIAGWYGQVSTVFPGDKTLSRIYPTEAARGKEEELGNPSFTPALIASIQVSEVIKLLIKRGEPLRQRLLFIDTLSQDYDIVQL